MNLSAQGSLVDCGIFNFIFQQIKTIRAGNRRCKIWKLIPKATQCWRESEVIGKISKREQLQIAKS